MAPSSTPCSKVNQPTTRSASPKLQPSTSGRPPYTTNSGASAVKVQHRDVKPSVKKSARYWSAWRVDALSCTPNSRR